MDGGPRDEDEERLVEGYGALVTDGVLEPLSTDAADTQRWMDCDLASFVENRLLETIDPMALTGDLRQTWTARATTADERIESPHQRVRYASPYWLLDARQRVGTIALSNRLLGTDVVTVWSLYVFPSHRGCGIAGRALRRCHDAACARGARGLRVSTSWSWQGAVRFYLGLGLWVASWKRDVAFTWREGLPAYRTVIGGDEAHFEVRRGEGWQRLITAEDRGERLGWHEEPVARSADGRRRYWEAPSTLAVVLAVRGWPLIRSDETWSQRHLWSDLGEPEGLAYKIEIFEAVDRKHGFKVRAPRIPGLRYRDLDEID